MSRALKFTKTLPTKNAVPPEFKSGDLSADSFNFTPLKFPAVANASAFDANANAATASFSGSASSTTGSSSMSGTSSVFAGSEGASSSVSSTVTGDQSSQSVSAFTFRTSFDDFLF